MVVFGVVQAVRGLLPLVLPILAAATIGEA